MPSHIFNRLLFLQYINVSFTLIVALKHNSKCKLNKAINRESVIGPVCLIFAVLQMRWKCKQTHSKHFLIEFLI